MYREGGDGGGGLSCGVREREVGGEGERERRKRVEREKREEREGERGGGGEREGEDGGRGDAHAAPQYGGRDAVHPRAAAAGTGGRRGEVRTW